MTKRCAALCLSLVLGSAPLAAQTQLVCFGNEPSWSLELPGGSMARFATPHSPSVTYRGAETRLPALKEWAWRGRPEGEAGGELVALLRESSCSDTMSDTKHPVQARVSLADGRLLAGCCRVVAAGHAAAAPRALEGAIWRLMSLSGAAPAELAAATRPITVRFQSGHVDGFSGCNQFAGSYAIDGDRVKIGALAGTMMACPQAAAALEDAFKNAFSGTLGYALAAEGLTLTAESGATLAFRAEPAPSLAGSIWEVAGFNNGRHAVVSPVAGTVLTLSFENGSVRGHAGCNSFRAPYRADGDRITIGHAATTRMACASKAVMDQEREFLAALESTTLWSVRAGVLDMHRADGERVVTGKASAR